MSGRPAHAARLRSSGRTRLRLRQLEHARPLHAVAFGVAIASASGLLFFALTAAECTQVVHAGFHESLSLLAEFFPGYEVTWRGAVVGFLWGAAIGFAVGWGLASIRNRMLSASLYFLRKRAQASGLGDAFDDR